MAKEVMSRPKFSSPPPKGSPPVSSAPRASPPLSTPQFSSPAPSTSRPVSQTIVRSSGGGSSSVTPQVSTTPERQAVLSGQQTQGGQAIRNIEGGRIKAPLQNVQGAQYVIGQGIRNRIIQEDQSGNFRFSQSATPEQRKTVIGALRKEGFNVEDRGGQIGLDTMNTAVKTPPPTARKIPPSDQLFSPGPTQGQGRFLASSVRTDRQFFSPGPTSGQVSSTSAIPRRIAAREAATRASQQEVNFYDYPIAVGRDIAGISQRSIIGQVGFDYLRQRESIRSEFGIRGTGKREEIVTAGLFSTSLFPQTRALGERGTRQTKRIATTFGVPEPVASAGLVTFLAADAGLTSAGVATGVGFLTNVGKVAVKEGAKKAGTVVVKKTVEALGSPVKLATLVKKDISPQTLKKAQTGLGIVNIGAVGADIAGVKTEYGSGFRSALDRGVQYFTFQSAPRERQSFLIETTVFNLPYFGARGIQAVIPTGTASRGLELAYRGANLGVIGLLGAQNVQEAASKGKGIEFAIGKTVGELAIQEDLVESGTIDKLFEGSRIYKGFQKKVVADIASGKKKAEYFDYFSAIDVPGSFSGFGARAKSAGKEAEFVFTKFVGEGGRGFRNFRMELKQELGDPLKQDFGRVKDAFKGVTESIRPSRRASSDADLRPDVRKASPDVKVDLRSALDIRPDIRPDSRKEIRRDLALRPPADLTPTVNPPALRPDFDITPDIKPDEKIDIKPDIRPDTRKDPLFPALFPGFLGGGRESGTTSRSKGKSFRASSQDLLTILLRTSRGRR